MDKTKSFFSFFLVLWFGMVLGVSMFSAPIKFLVPDMSREVQLQLGSITFKYFNYIEWSLLAIVGVLFLVLFVKAQFKKGKLLLALISLLLIVLLADTFYILPVLHDYVAALTNGHASIDSVGSIAPYHRLYIVGDSLKLILQLALYFMVCLQE